MSVDLWGSFLLTAYGFVTVYGFVYFKLEQYCMRVSYTRFVYLLSLNLVQLAHIVLFATIIDTQTPMLR